ncbi:SusC/RagA family TonB-linked outer membrane protein [Riemerella anatipestifer]|uniref:SusC/RagA family TonB-linked outer membrane protein n=1 Tax=Riemerella anatipestifer TaxID=34085 RepID=UPI00285B273B|nr:SusC/RagA family TonB-linked outer membrane protein [Riemerella anatipestifer]MDR7799546.1 SusC/RagA family TonB-linked outer membrane protein [Riemerella anatipestifer]
MKKTIITVFSLSLVLCGNEVYGQRKKDSTKTKEIEEVVVVAYGKQRKETVVGANAEIKAKDLAQRSLTNVAQALDGATPGVQVSTSTGQPGSGPAIRIRGFSSIGSNNSPLFIVDGTVYNGNIANLNPDDIESLNILKDAASTSLYGSSAANGVVMITTKKGKKGRSQFNFSASTGISTRSIPEYDRLNAAQYYPIVWEAIRNGQLYKPSGAMSLADANAYASRTLIPDVLKNNVYNVSDNQLVIDGVLNPNASLIYDDLDWQKEFFKVGMRQNYDFNYSGGTDKTTYYASFGYLKEDAYALSSDYERISARLNIDTQIKDWFKVGSNLAYSNSFSNQAIDGVDNNSSYVNPFNWTRNIGPIYNVYAHDPITGGYIYDKEGNRVYDAGDKRGAGAAGGRHVIQETLLNRNYDKIYNINSRFFGEFKLLPELTFTTNVGYDLRNYKGIAYRNKIIGDAVPNGAASRTVTESRTITFNQLLNYDKSFGHHNLNVLLGHENISYKYEYVYGRKTNQVVDNNDELVNFVTPTNLTSYDRILPKESYFSRLNYDYNRKYLLSASVRRDGSARFHKDVRWATFWSLGAGWRIDQENFLKGNSTISQLKLRGSYGQVGNDGSYSTDVSYYAWQPLYSLGYNNGDYAGVMMSSVGNTQLTWESNTQLDAALEFGFFNNRITGSVEYYKRGTDGLILSVPKPDSSGNLSRDENSGALVNSGIEVALSIDVIKTNNFKWNLNVNASTLKNEITKFPQDERIVGTKKYMVGKSIYDYWLRQWYGVDPADGMGLFYASDEAIAKGGTTLREINGVKVTTNHNDAKYDYSGSAIPQFFGSFGTTFRYKSVSLSALFTYQLGGKTYDSNYGGLMSAYPQGDALSTDILRRWQKPGDVTDVPRLDASNYQSVGVGSSRWLVNSGYITLRQVTLSYEMPREIVNPIGVNNLKIFVNGENIWSKTARKGLEPAQSFSGVTANRFTPARIISFGFSTNF